MKIDWDGMGRVVYGQWAEWYSREKLEGRGEAVGEGVEEGESLSDPRKIMLFKGETAGHGVGGSLDEKGWLWIPKIGMEHFNDSKA